MLRLGSLMQWVMGGLSPMSHPHILWGMDRKRMLKSKAKDVVRLHRLNRCTFDEKNVITD